MDTKVDLNSMATVLEVYSYAYLMTTGNNDQPHAVAVHTELVDTKLHVSGVDGRARADALEQPGVALVYLPAVVGGYALVIDGKATVHDDGLIVTPTRTRVGGREQFVRVARSVSEKFVA